jgi:hypothetical protein
MRLRSKTTSTHGTHGTRSSCCSCNKLVCCCYSPSATDSEESSDSDEESTNACKLVKLDGKPIAFLLVKHNFKYFEYLFQI